MVLAMSSRTPFKLEPTPKSVGVNIFVKISKYYRLIISLLTNSRRH
jgi:hypothetical protein